MLLILVTAAAGATRFLRSWDRRWGEAAACCDRVKCEAVRRGNREGQRRLLQDVAPRRPQGDGYADADRNDEKQRKCDSDEKAPHRLSWPGRLGD